MFILFNSFIQVLDFPWTRTLPLPCQCKGVWSNIEVKELQKQFYVWECSTYRTRSLQWSFCCSMCWFQAFAFHMKVICSSSMLQYWLVDCVFIKLYSVSHVRSNEKSWQGWDSTRSLTEKELGVSIAPRITQHTEISLTLTLQTAAFTFSGILLMTA